MHASVTPAPVTVRAPTPADLEQVVAIDAATEGRTRREYVERRLQAAHRGVGHALLSQLFANLGALRVERAETVVPQRDLDLLGFLYSAGFGASPRLVFTRALEPA